MAYKSDLNGLISMRDAPQDFWFSFGDEGSAQIKNPPLRTNKKRQEEEMRDIISWDIIT